MARPPATEYAPPYEGYISLVPEDDFLPAFQAATEETFSFLRSLPESIGGLRHPPYTWTIKEVVGHLTDAERVFGYRALRISRADRTPIPGFDENAYMTASWFNQVPLADLVAEFEALRRSHLYFFAGMPVEPWSHSGIANDNEITVRALAYIMLGHERHHMTIVRKRLSVS